MSSIRVVTITPEAQAALDALPEWVSRRKFVGHAIFRDARRPIETKLRTSKHKPSEATVGNSLRIVAAVICAFPLCKHKVMLKIAQIRRTDALEKLWDGN